VNTGFTLINEGGGGTFSKVQYPLCILQHEGRSPKGVSISGCTGVVGSR
jgi:hypothetical protein